MKSAILLAALAAVLSSSNATANGPGSTCADQHDGSSEFALGYQIQADVGWVVAYGGPGALTTVSSIGTSFATPASPTSFFTPISPVTVAIWNDPNNDGDPTDAVLLSSISVPISLASIATDVIQQVALPSPVTVAGVYFVGAYVTANPGTYPMPLDSSGADPCVSGTGGWVLGAFPGMMDLNDLATFALSLCDQGFPSRPLLHVECTPGPGPVAYCFGDGTGSACPCANVGLAGRGCDNSFATGGGRLFASGLPSVTADTLQLNASYLPPTSSALFFQGTQQQSGGAGAIFGDGLRCVAGSTIRLGTNFATAGLVNFGHAVPGNLPIHTGGLIPPSGGTREYQVWYRNAVSFCTSATFNLTNGVTVTWAP